MKVFRLLVAMGEGEEPKWVVMLAPGADLIEAEWSARLKFPGRLLAILQHDLLPASEADATTPILITNDRTQR